MTSPATHLVGYQLHTWTGSTAVFIFYWPQFFPSFQLGGCIWSAGLTPCPREMTEDLDTSNWAGCQDGRKLPLREVFTSAKERLFSQEREHYTLVWSREGSENLLLESIVDTEALSSWEKWPLTEDSLRDTGDTSSPTRHQVAMVLQHHIWVQVLLIGVQELPLLPRELHSHVVICRGFLSQHGPV